MQDNENGYIQIPRAHPIWSFRPYDLRVALELIRRATHQDITFRHHGQDIQLKRGQLFISIRQLARDCGIDREALRRVIHRLNRTHFLTHFCTHLGIVVTVCDYNYFNESKRTYAPTKAPTNQAIVGGQNGHSGCFQQSPLYNEQGTLNNQDKISNKEENNYKEPTGKKPLTEENFDRSEIPSLKEFFKDAEALAQHLRNRGFVEQSISRILDWFNPPKEGLA
jgi:hypothetical protein